MTAPSLANVGEAVKPPSKLHRGVLSNWCGFASLSKYPDAPAKLRFFLLVVVKSASQFFRSDISMPAWLLQCHSFQHLYIHHDTSSIVPLVRFAVKSFHSDISKQYFYFFARAKLSPDVHTLVGRHLITIPTVIFCIKEEIGWFYKVLLRKRSL